MCGIFGYVGKQSNAASIVFEGLKLLEYRGYDSWGVAVKIKNSEFAIEKRVEKHEKGLEDKLKALGYTEITVGNADTTDNTETTVTFKKTLSQAVQDELKKELERLAARK